MLRFVGRRFELAKLRATADATGGQLVMVYGRRRIGKSYLLEHFSRGLRTIFYQATQQAEAIELRAFSDEARAIVGLPDGVSFTHWEQALDALAKSAHRERTIAILDEFPYLCESTQGLPSIIQRWWDKRGKSSHLMLVLCGSAQTYMEHLDIHSAPLYNRFTVKLKILPLHYRDAAEFVPHLKAEEKARVFGILGGTPFNLEQWNATIDVRENLRALFGDPTSSVVDSAARVLTTSLSDARAAFRVLQGIAKGHSRHAEIQDFAKVQTRVLPHLIEAGFIERRVPVTENPEKSRRVVYRIPDPYFRFWFRFILPNQGAIERGLGDTVIDEQILPHLDDHMGQSFEDISSQFVIDLVRNRRLRADDVGTWWSADGQHEIDIVGVTSRKPSFLGTVKWQRQPLDRRVLTNLQIHASALGADDDLPLLMIGRGGVEAALLDLPEVRSFSAEDLYSPTVGAIVS